MIDHRYAPWGKGAHSVIRGSQNPPLAAGDLENKKNGHVMTDRKFWEIFKENSTQTRPEPCFGSGLNYVSCRADSRIIT